MSDEAAFIDAIVANPDDEALRQVYADWLEDRGDARAEFLRLGAVLATLPATDQRVAPLASRLQEVQGRLDADWLALMDRAPVEGCFRFAYACPRRWEYLKPTDDVTIRFCDGCRKKVFHCRTVAHAQRHALRGHCVAIGSHLVRRKDDLDADPGRDPTVMLMGEGELPLPRYRPGQQVTVRVGPFQGLLGEVEQVHLSELRLTLRLDGGRRGRLVQVAFEDVEEPEEIDDDEDDDEDDMDELGEYE